MRYAKFDDIPPFISWGHYEVDVPWDSLERHLQRHLDDIGLDLDPDFQRGHVWTQAQQVAYVEHCLRGGQSSRMLLWNCSDWHECTGKYPLTLVDGKQRMEAVRSFLRDDLRVFGSLRSQYEDRLGIGGPCFRFNVNALKTRAEVLRWYLEINAGGVVHAEEELDRVRELLTEEPT